MAASRLGAYTGRAMRRITVATESAAGAGYTAVLAVAGPASLFDGVGKGSISWLPVNGQ